MIFWFEFMWENRSYILLQTILETEFLPKLSTIMPEQGPINYNKRGQSTGTAEVIYQSWNFVCVPWTAHSSSELDPALKSWKYCVSSNHNFRSFRQQEILRKRFRCIMIFSKRHHFIFLVWFALNPLLRFVLIFIRDNSDCPTISIARFSEPSLPHSICQLKCYVEYFYKKERFRKIGMRSDKTLSMLWTNQDIFL